MKQIKFISKISNYPFLKKSRTWIDYVFIGLFHKLENFDFRYCHGSLYTTNIRERNIEAKLGRGLQVLVKDVGVEGMAEFNDKDKRTLAMCMETEIVVPIRENVAMDKEEMVKAKEIKEEKKMRLKSSFDVLSRLKEIQVMEASDLDQFIDLNEALLCYSLVQNDFYVDLLNQFIVNVSEEICRSRCRK
ncbi:hypothetical protein FRX31_034554 [Thalictrum thalictroides]|uniref:Uncharacterized protein n=1 Tax=Thalictrum thalictroides TaxID=46969 RepID=A0A7J6UTD8_THATH|nr:hypothetical protein FRX31_034554 [Thalictrum thalictroides]